MARPENPLRGWQQRALAEMAGWTSGSFLISAAPGAGKTRPALEFARNELAQRRIRSVVIACPTAPLTRQWARVASGLGLELAPDAPSPKPPRGFHGVTVTYARIAQAPRRWAAAARSASAGPGLLVIADEAHHLGEDLAWGEGFSTAFEPARRWLLLSGTPFRSDATAIPGVRYDADGVTLPDVSYSYADAVLDGACRPVCFVAYDGALSWRSGDDVIESSFETILPAREASRRYRTAISTELPDGLPRILREADTKLRELRRAGRGDEAGLVVAADSDHARRIAKLLRETSGRAPLVVLHTEARAADKLAAFTRGREPWIVAVNMVSEGVDIPRLRVGVYATAAKTALVFRQIVGRFVRTIPREPLDPSWLYVPADPLLRDHVESVSKELRIALRRDDDPHDGAFSEPRERAATEPAATTEFQPLSADVAPQMTLFGGSAPSTRPHRAARPEPASTADLASTADPPAFERRARLRSERHRLVSELRRRDGSSHRDINTWLNHKVGIGTVEEATIDELERSVELLVKRLTSKR